MAVGVVFKFLKIIDNRKIYHELQRTRNGRLS